jgi:hypothetical protein
MPEDDSLAGSRRARLRRSVAAAVMAALAGASGCSDADRSGGVRDVYLRCTGTIAFIGLELYSRENESIAAHIQNRHISFSGNDYLGGENIPFCSAHPDGTPLDDSYLQFDTDPCGPTTTGRNRTYGTYYWVLGRLDLSHSSSEPVSTPHVQGRFQCTPVQPFR